MNVDTKQSLKLSRIIKASPDRVFSAWTDPEQIKRWSAPEGMSIPEAEVDLTVGGTYRIRMESPEGNVHTAYGTYREIVPFERLVYTWDWEEENSHLGGTLITVEFTDLGESTEVVITHDLFPTEEVRDAHETGWTSCLNRLVSLFAESSKSKTAGKRPVSQYRSQ